MINDSCIYCREILSGKYPGRIYSSTNLWKGRETRQKTRIKKRDIGGSRGTKDTVLRPQSIFFHLMQFSAKMIPIGNPGFATTRPFHVVLKSFPQISTNLFLYLASHSMSPVKFLHIDLFYSESFVENM